MALGNPLIAQEFADFFNATGPATATTPTGFIMEAVEKTYLWGRLAAGDVIGAKRVQGGESIEFSTIFSDYDTWEEYEPGEFVDYQNIQVLSKGTINWRFSRGHCAWAEQELLLNRAITEGREEFKFQAFVDMQEEKEAVLQVTAMNGLERALWRIPNATQMEGSGAGKKQPYSIMSLVNEETNGLHTGFTTVEGLTPGDHLDEYGVSRWAPQQKSYSSAAQDNRGNIIAAFDDMFQEIEFQVPSDRQEFFESPRLNKQLIITSPAGRTIYMQLLRGGQDHYIAGPQDPSYPDPQFMGIPVTRSKRFGQTAYYDGGTLDEFNASTAGKGPRFLWINGNFLFPVIHRQRSFHRTAPRTQFNVPDVWAVNLFVWWNLLAPSRQRHGMVFPAVGTSVYTS